MSWFDMAYPQLRGRLFAVPNGGHRHISVALKLKAEGVRSGVPDLFLLEPRHGFHGLAIEMKDKGGKLSKAQADWLDWLTGRGYCATVCVGSDVARETIASYLASINNEHVKNA